MISVLRAFLLFLSFNAICSAQAERASITGTVTDSSGAPISGGFPSAYNQGDAGRNLLGGRGEVNFDFNI